MMRRGPVLAALAVLLLCAAAFAGPAWAAGSESGDVVRFGDDVTVRGTVERVVVVAGDVRLTAGAHVLGDAVVLLGDLHKDPGAQVDGGEYVAGRSIVDWVPGPTWVGILVLVALGVLYRLAVWAAVSAIAGALVRTSVFERWAVGWEGRPALALALGMLLVAIALPAVALLALTTILLPVALLGLAGLLVACGAGLALFREGPMWPRRPNRLAMAAVIVLPPALEIVLLVTAAGGLGSGARAIGRLAGPATPRA